LGYTARVIFDRDAATSAPGETHDNQLCSVLLSELRPQTMLLADRGYDADWIRAFASDQGAWANIPPAYESAP
jgi:transposase